MQHPSSAPILQWQWHLFGGTSTKANSCCALSKVATTLSSSSSLLSSSSVVVVVAATAAAEGPASPSSVPAWLSQSISDYNTCIEHSLSELDNSHWPYTMTDLLKGSRNTAMRSHARITMTYVYTTMVQYIYKTFKQDL